MTRLLPLAFWLLVPFGQPVYTLLAYHGGALTVTEVHTAAYPACGDGLKPTPATPCMVSQ